jgi:two-component system cell cycle sensor histidine kinase/response regulator CckA
MNETLNPAQGDSTVGPAQSPQAEVKRIIPGLSGMTDESVLRLFRFTIDQAADSIFWSAADGHLEYVNDAACRLLGYSSPELLKLRVWDVYSGQTAESWKERVAQIKQAVIREESSACRHRDGRLIPVEVTVKYLRADDKEFMCAYVRDITERKRTEEIHARLVAAIEQAAESVVITSTDGAILYVNPAFEKTTGYTIKEALGSNSRILKSGMHGAEFYRQMWETLRRGEVWHGRLINKKKDGTIYKEDATISPVRDHAGRIVNYVALKLNVTRELQLEDQLHHSQKLEAVARLAGGIAHDFNNLLTVINGYSSLMLERLSPDSLDRSNLTEISHAGTRAASLTRQLLAFSRKQIIQPVILDLNVLMAGLGTLLTRLLGEDIEVNVRTNRGLGKIKADPGQIEQVLMNLCINARDAMPGGGKLSIETLNVDLGPEHQEARLDLPPGPYVMLTVSDTGCGMDENTQSHLFEPFFTTKEVGKGTGLGLSTVYGIVTRAGGRISCQSAAGKGTTFVIVFPRCDESAETSRVAADRPSARGSETILLVEDDNTVRTLARVVLERYGYRVLEAFNGEEGLKRAMGHSSTIDMLVTDMVMPGMNGLQLIDGFSSRHPEASILIMSGYSDTAITDTELRRKGLSYIDKPFGPEALASKVRGILDKRRARNAKGSP